MAEATTELTHPPKVKEHADKTHPEQRTRPGVKKDHSVKRRIELRYRAPSADTLAPISLDSKEKTGITNFDDLSSKLRESPVPLAEQFKKYNADMHHWVQTITAEDRPDRGEMKALLTAVGIKHE